VGSTVVVTVNDASWAAIGEWVWVAGAGGSGQAGALQITAISGNQLTLLNSASTPAPLSDAPSDGNLYARKNAAWISPIVSADAGNSATVGSDKLVYVPYRGPLAIRTFTASGTYTPTAGMTKCLIECVGGGGAGGGVTGSANLNFIGGGGGSGGYSRKLATAAQIGASQTVTIGAGGTGVSGAAGNAGGATSIGSLCIANGGSGGFFASNSAAPTGATGAAPGTGDLAASGAPGAPGIYTQASTFYGPGGTGGSSIFGGGAVAIWTGGSSVNAGAAAQGYGGGGSGAGAMNNTGSAAGGAGSAGIAIISEYA